MKFEHYIQDVPQDFHEMIKRDCKPWLTATNKCMDPFFYRGSTGINFFKKKPRKDRRTRNTPDDQSKEIDIGFKKEFGWKPRSEGVFITSSILDAKYYGDAYFFFAIGNFKYVWSPDIDDLYNRLSKVMAKLEDEHGNPFDEEPYQEVAKLYQNNDLCSAQSAQYEVTVKCKEYYMLNQDIWSKQELKKLLY